MYIKTYTTLPAPARHIRTQVFMAEQGFTDEFDAQDQTATHLVLYSDAQQAIATCRYFPDETTGTWIVGRIAVVKAYRRHHYGQLILHEVEQQARAAGIPALRLAAQVHAVGFYEKQGFVVEGDVFFEEHCPHRWMQKNLTK